MGVLDVGGISPASMVASNLCIGCGSCVAVAPGDARASIDFDPHGLLRPRSEGPWFEHPSDLVASACPFSPMAADEDTLAEELFADPGILHTAAGRFLNAFVGSVTESDYRSNGSSGGMVSWVLTELMRTGAIDGVAHVAAVDDPRTDGRFFRYRISRSFEEIREGAKSRYYPVEMSDVLRTIRSIAGHYAVVGVPCFIKAVQLLRRQDPILRERIVATLGLFCGHMKSARFVESFAWQMDVPIGHVETVDFRLKDPARPASTYTAAFTLDNGQTVRRDWWNLVDGDWGAGFFQDPACNFCDDVVAELADISFGDAWVEPYASDGRGTNVVVVRTPAMLRLIEAGMSDGRLALEVVDGDFVERTQAAGFRQRRVGLGYRLTWLRSVPVMPRKRVAPRSSGITLRRKLVYRMRAAITYGSHRMFRLARAVRWRGLFIGWARPVVAIYHALTYSRGRLGILLDRIGLR